MLFLVVVEAGEWGGTYEASDEVRVRELAGGEAVREYLGSDRVDTTREELALSRTGHRVSVSLDETYGTRPLLEKPCNSAASKALGACAVIAWTCTDP